MKTLIMRMDVSNVIGSYPTVALDHMYGRHLGALSMVVRVICLVLF